jgi:hypothetical protein
VEICYAQNLLFLVERSRLSEESKLAEEHRRLPDGPLDLVHPRLFLETTAFAKGPKELFHGTLGAIRDRWLIRSRREAFFNQRRLGKWPTQRDAD